jgi:hypothetical protein
MEDHAFYSSRQFDYHEQAGNGNPPEAQYSCPETGSLGLGGPRTEYETPTSPQLALETMPDDAEGIFPNLTWSQSPRGVTEDPDWMLPINYHQEDTGGVVAQSLSQSQQISYPPPIASESVGDEPLASLVGVPQLDFETAEMPLPNMSLYVNLHKSHYSSS